jgi:hypothetical protein
MYQNEPKDASSITHVDKMTYEEHEQNLMIVYAVEGYAKRHNLSEQETLALFKQHDIINAIRKFHGVLHTQDLDENVFFAEDIIKRRIEWTV